MKLVEFPVGNVQDIARGLRSLADTIETGLEGDAEVPGLTDATMLVWVATNKDRVVEVGMLGGSSNRFTVAGLMQAGAVQLLTPAPAGRER
jgi:hypothetical protein